EALRRQGRYDEALPLYADAIGRHRALGDRRSIALELHNLGSVARLSGDPDTASTHLRESLSLAGEIGHERLVGYCLIGLAEIAAARGSPAAAARLIGASDARFAAVGAARDPEYAETRERTCRLAAAVLGEEALR